MADDRTRQKELERELRLTREALRRSTAERRKIRETFDRFKWEPRSGSASRSQGGPDETIYRWVAYTAAGLAIVGGFLLGVGHLAARVADGAWPSYEPGDAPGILMRLITEPGDPGAAWEPVNGGGRPPGPVAWWVTFLVVVVVLAVPTILVWRRLRRRADIDGAGIAGGAEDGEVDDRAAGALTGGKSRHRRWGGRREARRLQRSPDGSRGGVVVGVHGKRTLTLDPLESLMVVGPAHTGKTSGIAIPTLLDWPGPAVAASTKGYLMDQTIGWRSQVGEVLVYDPAGVSGYDRAGWSPLHDCGTWQGALRTAQQLTAAAKASVGGQLDGGDPDHITQGALWSGAMSLALAPYLYAAAADGRTMIETAEWLEREERDEILAILSPVDEVAAHAHETTFFRDDPARSAYFHVMFQVLSVYSDPTVAATADRHNMTPSELLDRGRDTVYLTAPEHDNIRFQPLFATIVRQVVTAVNERFALQGRPLHPPLLFVLDEAAGVAALEALAELASTGATKGVQVVSTFEALSRLEGLAPETVSLLTRNHRAKLVLGERTHAAGVQTDLLAPVVAGQLGRGEGALVRGGEPPLRVKLRRWYEDSELRSRGDTEVSDLRQGPGNGSASPAPPDSEDDYQLIEEDALFAWSRRRRRSAGRAGEAPDREPGGAGGRGSRGGSLDEDQKGMVEIAGLRVPSVEEILARADRNTRGD